MIDLKDLCGESEPPECKNFQRNYNKRDECKFHFFQKENEKLIHLCNIHRTGGRGPGKCPYPWMIF